MRSGIFILIGWLYGFAAAAQTADYAYPIQDPYLATVMGTARADRAPVPRKVPDRIRRLIRFPDREISPVFFDSDEFSYTVSLQKRAAPLIFVIAGTGASHRSAKMRFLQRAFYGAGMHVVLLSSPTYPDFMLTASEAGMPGWMRADVQDLYEIMKLIRANLGEEIEISRFYLTGYSLGASESAFLGVLDRRERAFDFERILLLNPSVSLFTSARLLDELFEKGLPDGPASVERILADLLAEIAEYVRKQPGTELEDELLYRIAKQRIAEGRRPQRQTLDALIAAVFRLSSADLVFTSDVIHGGGHVVEPGRPLGTTSSLTLPFERSIRWPFVRYLDDMLVPYWSGREPTLDRAALIESADLASIRRYLASTSRVGVMTNADDIILTPANLEFLRETFGSRATIYPVGGHCGNLQYRDNVAAMLHFFAGAAETAQP